jgi:hypothetical protein
LLPDEALDPNLERF